MLPPFTDRKQRARSRRFSADAWTSSIWAQVSMKKSAQPSQTQPQQPTQPQSPTRTQAPSSPPAAQSPGSSLLAQVSAKKGGSNHTQPRTPAPQPQSPIQMQKPGSPSVPLQSSSSWGLGGMRKGAQLAHSQQQQSQSTTATITKPPKSPPPPQISSSIWAQVSKKSSRAQPHQRQHVQPAQPLPLNLQSPVQTASARVTSPATQTQIAKDIAPDMTQVSSPSVGKKRTRAVKEQIESNVVLNSFSLQAAQAAQGQSHVQVQGGVEWNQGDIQDETASKSTGGMTGSFSTDETSSMNTIGRGASRPIQRYVVRQEKHELREQQRFRAHLATSRRSQVATEDENELNSVKRDIFGSSSSGGGDILKNNNINKDKKGANDNEGTRNNNEDDGRSGQVMFSENQVQDLLLKIQQLEMRLQSHENRTMKARKDIRERMDSAELKMEAVARTHEALNTELDDNQLRVGKTEQYLDAMRRDLLTVLGKRRWRFVQYGRESVNNVLYYLLAYLVPVLAFVIRLIRDLVIRLRRRHVSIGSSSSDIDSEDEDA